MKRREFIRMLGAAGVTLPFAPLWLRAAEAAESPYTGDLLIFINTQGGWDPLQFCDPKNGMRPWVNEIPTAGRIRYANQSHAGQNYAADFFPVFGDRMVVVQGINMQTNAHTAGITNAFQGTFASGFPTLSAALAAATRPDLPMSYMVTGNYRSTGDLLPYTAISQSGLISTLAKPNDGNDLGNSLFPKRIPDDVFAMVDAARRARIDRLMTDTLLMPRRRRMLEYFSAAVEGSQAVENLGAILPQAPDTFRSTDEHGIENDLVKQADVILHAMAAGITVAADAEFLDNRFDSHADHQTRQGNMLARLVYGIRFIWQRAAEIQARAPGSNLVNRLVLVIHSDFGRSPAINGDGGTDHWPTSSAIVMRQDFATNDIGNRVVGYSTDDYLSGRIDPVTLARQESGGVELTSAHLHKALRTYFRIDNAQILEHVGFDVAPVAIFDAARSTPQLS